MYIELLDTNKWDYLHEMKLYLQKYPPTEIIYKKNNISPMITEIFDNLSCNPLITKL